MNATITAWAVKYQAWFIVLAIPTSISYLVIRNNKRIVGDENYSGKIWAFWLLVIGGSYALCIVGAAGIIVTTAVIMLNRYGLF